MGYGKSCRSGGTSVSIVINKGKNLNIFMIVSSNLYEIMYVVK